MRRPLLYAKSIYMQKNILRRKTRRMQRIVDQNMSLRSRLYLLGQTSRPDAHLPRVKSGKA